MTDKQHPDYRGMSSKQVMEMLLLESELRRLNPGDDPGAISAFLRNPDPTLPAGSVQSINELYQMWKNHPDSGVWGCV